MKGRTLVLLLTGLFSLVAFADENLTSLISNPGFETGDLTNWTVQTGVFGSDNIVPAVITASSDNFVSAGSYALKFPLSYGTADATTEARVSQTLNGLAAGNYILKAQIRGKRWEAANGLFANGGAGEVKEATNFNSPSNISGQFNWVSLAFTVNESGTATIGAYASKRRTGNDRANDFWVDDFQLFRADGSGTVIADFETGGVSPSYSDNGGCTSGSLAIVNNPDNTCLNASAKTLYAKTSGSTLEGGDWWKGIEIDIADFSVSYANARYLHILMRTNLPKFEMDIHTDGDKWNGASSSHRQDLVWFDYLVDLKNVKEGVSDGATVTKLRIAFSCNESGQQGKEIYIDEIVLNNDATLRTCGDEPPAPEPTPVWADFETGGVNPSFTDNGGCTSGSLAKVANPDNACLNTSATALYAKTSGSTLEGGDWWKGLEIDVTDVTINTSEARYLHILLRTNLPKFEMDVHTSSDVDNWNGNSTTHPTDLTWFDYVINLGAVKDANLNGKTVTKLRIAFSANDAGQQGKDIYIDEIVLNNDATPRTCTLTGLPETAADAVVATEYYNLQGIKISNPASSSIYVVKKIYASKKTESKTV
ncbi:MAG: hypothetical protein LBG77_05180, partial [Dysgonamonadaceae bacterium]|nr:hypothetical protein [Dysgonamonadaceae bacterium]